MPHYSL
jgi:hypothetical protein